MGADCQSPPDVQNLNTPFIDASFLYGSDAETASSLRQFEGGLLKTSADKRGRTFPPISTDDGGVKMEFGDRRSDVHPGFTMIATVFVRIHNRKAAALAQMHPEWDDETVYQETRKILVAVLQHVAYTQFIDALLGEPNDVHVHAHDAGFEDVYDPRVDPTISIGFGTAGYRLHTYVPGHLVLRDRNYRETNKLVIK